VFDQISRAIPGGISRGELGELRYQPNGYANTVDIRNISAGMKTFAILDQLLRNGSLEQRSTVILDEPEVHLHPEWQLVLAELIVLLQKTYGLHVLLTTHSPYFLRAIQVYAAKHSIASRCRYYQAVRVDRTCRIEDVSKDTSSIFERLVRPFEILEQEMTAL
jgi:predicted ATPase